MLYMVELRLQPDNLKRAMEIFEERGPNRNPGVQFRGGWLDTQAGIAFVLAESDDEKRIKEVAEFWSRHGSHQIHPVINIEQF